MKDVRSRCCKTLEKLASVLKNTSMAEIEGASRDLCLPLMAIGQSSLIGSPCERPQDGYNFVVALIGSEVHSIVTYQ